MKHYPITVLLCRLYNCLPIHSKFLYKRVASGKLLQKDVTQCQDNAKCDPSPIQIQKVLSDDFESSFTLGWLRLHKIFHKTTFVCHSCLHFPIAKISFLFFQNLPFQIQNRYRLTALFIVFFGSGIAAPFMIVRHQLLKK